MWTLIEAPEKWVEYKRNFLLKQFGVSGPIGVTWGADPAAYPCLVATIFPPQSAIGEPRAYSAFVYLSDCEDLLRAVNKKAVSLDRPLPPDQDQFNRWMAAEMLAVIHLLTRTGLCAPKGGEEANQQAFEDLVVQMLEKVDAYRNEQVQLEREYETKLLDVVRSPKQSS